MASTGLAAAQLAAVVLGSLGLATPVMAYVGPGVGLTAVGIPFALIVGLVLAIIGFVWYPLRRLRRNRKAAAQRPAQ
jgi:TM2 domain-containing membrane protein YozV